MGSQLQIHRAKSVELLHTHFVTGGFWTFTIRVQTEEGEILVSCFSTNQLPVKMLDVEKEDR